MDAANVTSDIQHPSQRIAIFPRRGEKILWMVAPQCFGIHLIQLFIIKPEIRNNFIEVPRALVNQRPV